MRLGVHFPEMHSMSFSVDVERVRRRALLAAVVASALAVGCGSASSCASDADCPAGAACSGEFHVCFERLSFTPLLAAGDSHSCAGTTTTGVVCWGANTNGRLGDGTASDRLLPTPVVDASGRAPLVDVRAIGAGAFHSCAVQDGGQVACWGWNQAGQVTGTPDAGVSVLRPMPFTSLGGVTGLALGQSHSCAVTGDGRIGCWGDNAQGQLGRWAIRGDSSSLAASADAGVIVAGNFHSCAITGDRRLMCWGGNTDAQANWRLSDRRPAAPDDMGLSGVVSVAAGQSHSCAVVSQGDVICWGANEKGQLGRATAAPGTNPSTLPTLGGARSVAAGCNHSCALLQDGGVACWGDNGSGELGNGTVSPSATPVAVATLPAAQALVAGCRHSCAFVRGPKGGAVYCWGDGSRGQLGDGGRQGSTVPMPVTFGEAP